MKKIMNMIMPVMLIVSMSSCAQNTAKTEQSAENAEEKTETVKEDTSAQTEETVDDPSWETLNSLGRVETENGLLFVSITLPAEMVGETVTQESIDDGAGNTYTSGKLNEDGSVTYKMTKQQHKAMLDGLAEMINTETEKMVSQGDYAVSEISHNDDYTSFDVKLTGEEIGLNEGFMAFALYMYGGMYNIFTGKTVDITVNYYSSGGALINTISSADADK